MRYLTIGRYQVSIVFILTLSLVVPSALVAAAYLWTARTIPFVVEEPLTVANYPASFNVNPGQNRTLDIVILNSADINYSVTLLFRLNDTAYQQSYVEFSNNTYNIAPGTNNIQGWARVDRKAPPVSLELTIEFHRE